MTFASSSTYEPTSTTHAYGAITFTTPDDRGKYAGIAGVYNPKTALATLLQVRGGLMNASGLYDLAAVGLLAPLYSSRQQSAFAALKDALVVPRPRWRQGFEPRDGWYVYLGPLGACGLGLQPYTDGSLNRTQSIPRAAMTAGIYRQPPQAFTGRGHA